jgi:hypothetical protein
MESLTLRDWVVAAPDLWVAAFNLWPWPTVICTWVLGALVYAVLKRIE